MFDFLDIDFIYGSTKLLSAILFGSLIFFAAVLAPTIFMTLDQPNARKLIRAIFPKLYMWGFVISLFVSILNLYQVSFITLIAFLISFGFIFSRQILMPKINEASDLSGNKTDENKRFKKLHSLSVLIFVLQLILILFLYFYF